MHAVRCLFHENELGVVYLPLSVTLSLSPRLCQVFGIWHAFSGRKLRFVQFVVQESAQQQCVVHRALEMLLEERPKIVLFAM